MAPPHVIYRLTVYVNWSPCGHQAKVILSVSLRFGALRNQEKRHQFKRIVKGTWLSKSYLVIDQDFFKLLYPDVLVETFISQLFCTTGHVS